MFRQDWGEIPNEGPHKIGGKRLFQKNFCLFFNLFVVSFSSQKRSREEQCDEPVNQRLRKSAFPVT